MTIMQSGTQPGHKLTAAEEITILMVDDDDVDVMGLERAFRRTGRRNPIVVAPDGLAALSLLRDGHSVRRPYLVLLDINMPRMTGLEFLGAVRADAQLHDAVVFMLTTSKAEEDKIRAYQHNIAGYLVKESANGGFASAVALLEHYQQRVEFP